jgi:hypothetical protein
VITLVWIQLWMPTDHAPASHVSILMRYTPMQHNMLVCGMESQAHSLYWYSGSAAQFASVWNEVTVWLILGTVSVSAHFFGGRSQVPNTSCMILFHCVFRCVFRYEKSHKFTNYCTYSLKMLLVNPGIWVRWLLLMKKRRTISTDLIE